LDTADRSSVKDTLRDDYEEHTQIAVVLIEFQQIYNKFKR